MEEDSSGEKAERRKGPSPKTRQALACILLCSVSSSMRGRWKEGRHAMGGPPTGGGSLLEVGEDLPPTQPAHLQILYFAALTSPPMRAHARQLYTTVWKEEAHTCLWTWVPAPLWPH